jgi:hypothetical protein
MSWILAGTENESAIDMTLTFVIAACAFAALLGALVAWIDWWRDSRLAAAHALRRARLPMTTVPTVSAARKRAA